MFRNTLSSRLTQGLFNNQISTAKWDIPRALLPSLLLLADITTLTTMFKSGDTHKYESSHKSDHKSSKDTSSMVSIIYTN